MRYNNQWMIVDWKKFVPGKPLANNTLVPRVKHVLSNVLFGIASCRAIHFCGSCIRDSIS